MKMVAVADFLTPEEINKAIRMYKEKSPALPFHPRCRDEIIKPVMSRINDDLGQENDPAYLAYAVEYALSQMQ